jgi:NADH-quinone oxidoreductase subunit M
VLLAIGRDEQANAVRWIALIGALLGPGRHVPLYTGFEVGSAAMQFVESILWIEPSTSTTTWRWTASRSGWCC